MAKKIKVLEPEYMPEEGRAIPNREDKFKGTEWAIQKGYDPHLFLYWENQMLSEQEFEKLVKEVKGE